MGSGITSIRPKVVFQKVEAQFPNDNVGFKVNIPSTAIGGMTLLESSILVSLCKLFQPYRLFEFGTYLGATTLLLAENTRDHARVVTVDIPAAEPTMPASELRVLEDGNDNDAFLRLNFLTKGATCINRARPEVRMKVTQIYQDSKTLDPGIQRLAAAFDYIFIDGGHDLETVRVDTRNALQMAKPDAVIIWHDFDSKIHGDVTKFLRGYSQEHAIFHVEHTMLAFELRGRYANAF